MPVTAWRCEGGDEVGLVGAQPGHAAGLLIVGEGGIEGVFELAILQMKIADAVVSGIMQRLIFLVVQECRVGRLIDHLGGGVAAPGHGTPGGPGDAEDQPAGNQHGEQESDGQGTHGAGGGSFPILLLAGSTLI